jgi:P-type Mg2+ transporter
MDAKVTKLRHQAQATAGAEELHALSHLSTALTCQKLQSSPSGLAPEEAARRLQDYGLNLITRERKPTIVQEIWSRTKNPLNALLLTLAVVSYFSGDPRAAIVIVVMVFLSVVTAFIQEHRSKEAAAQLRAMVKTTTSVRRGGAPTIPRYRSRRWRLETS